MVKDHTVCPEAIVSLCDIPDAMTSLLGCPLFGEGISPTGKLAGSGDPPAKAGVSLPLFGTWQAYSPVAEVQT